MGIAANALQKVRETADIITPTAESLRSSASNTLQGAWDSIRGSGSLTTEIKRVGQSALGIFAEPVGGVLQATKNFLTLHPVEAVRAITSAGIETCKNVGSFVTSPTALSWAAAKGSLNATKTVASKMVEIPTNAGVKVKNTLLNGLDGVLSIWGPVSESSPSVASKAPDLGAATTPSTPPSTPAA